KCIDPPSRCPPTSQKPSSGVEKRTRQDSSTSRRDRSRSFDTSSSCARIFRIYPRNQSAIVSTRSLECSTCIPTGFWIRDSRFCVLYSEFCILTSDMRDVIVIGGGHNALVAAFYLAKGGKSPLVLERRAVIGGCATSEEFAPGYR